MLIIFKENLNNNPQYIWQLLPYVTCTFDGILKSLASIDKGKLILVNEKQPWKESDPIELTDEGIDIRVIFEHPKKAQHPIAVTEEGIDICSNDEHS